MKYLQKGMSDSDFSFEDLVGYTLIDVIEKHEDSDEIHLVTKDFTIKMYHQQDCCESVYIEDICGDWDDLLNTPLVMAREDFGVLDNVSESGSWTFYNLGTNRGGVNIRWCGESNGYYSESVNLKII